MGKGRRKRKERRVKVKFLSSGQVQSSLELDNQLHLYWTVYGK